MLHFGALLFVEYGTKTTGCCCISWIQSCARRGPHIGPGVQAQDQADQLIEEDNGDNEEKLRDLLKRVGEGAQALREQFPEDWVDDEEGEYTEVKYEASEETKEMLKSKGLDDSLGWPLVRYLEAYSLHHLADLPFAEETGRAAKGKGGSKKRKVSSDEPQDRASYLDKAMEIYWLAIKPIGENEMGFEMHLILTGVAQAQTARGAVAAALGETEKATELILNHEHDIHFTDLDGIQVRSLAPRCELTIL